MGKPLNEERAPFSRSQKGRKGPFPSTSCSPAPAALALAGDTCRCQMLGSRPALRGEWQYRLCVVPVPERCGGVCRAAVLLHKGCPGPPMPPVTPFPGLALGSARPPGIGELWRRGEAVLLVALSCWSETPRGSAGHWPCTRRLPLRAPGLLARPSPAARMSPARHRPNPGHGTDPSGGTGWYPRGGEERLPRGGCSQEHPVPGPLAFQPTLNRVTPAAEKFGCPVNTRGKGKRMVSCPVCGSEARAGPGGASHLLPQKGSRFGHGP